MRSPQRITSKELLSNGKVITSTSPTSTSVQTSRAASAAFVLLDPDDRAAALDERTREIPARASDVEHPLSRPDEIEEPSMAAEGTGVQLDVAGRVGRGQRSHAGPAVGSSRRRGMVRARGRRRRRRSGSRARGRQSAPSRRRPAECAKPFAAHSTPTAVRPAMERRTSRMPRRCRARASGVARGARAGGPARRCGRARTSARRPRAGSPGHRSA